MKTILLSVLLLFLGYGALAQTSDEKVPRFQKVAIGNSGTYAYFPDDEEFVVDVSYSPDSSEVYTGEVLCGNYHFAIIVVNLNGMELTTTEERNDMLVAYLDYLQGTFAIEEAVGYGKGHTLSTYPEAVGMLDYWLDADGDEWAVKGWADRHKMAVMMLYGSGSYPHTTAEELFLNGFRFDNR